MLNFFSKSVILAGDEVVKHAIQEKKSFSEVFIQRIEWYDILPYMRIQVLYWMYWGRMCLTDPDLDKLAAHVLELWGTRIKQNGLFASVRIPDDSKMNKILSRKTEFVDQEFERQGHQHSNDKTPILDRIYGIHAILSENE